MEPWAELLNPDYVDLMNSPLTWIAPPLIGAFIGYLTNYVAIRMLFRPLKPWRIFSIRIPMTPGVIPSKRHDLAQNIGSMVGDHLLTSQDVGKALGKESFQVELRNLIGGRVEDFVQRDLGPLPSLIPQQFRSYFTAWIKISRWRALKHLHNHIDSKQFADGLSKALDERFTDLLDRNLDEIMPPEMLSRFIEFLEDTAGDLLTSPEVEKWLTTYIDRRLKEFLENGRSLADLIPADLSSQLLNRLEQETPGLLHKLAETIQEPTIQDRIADALCRAVDGFTASLGPMAALLGNFISPGAIQTKIKDYLSNNGEELSKWLLDESVQDRVADVLREKANSLLNAPLAELLKDVDPDKIASGRTAVAGQIMSFLRDPATGKAISNLLQDTFKAQEGRDLNELLTVLFGANGPKEAKNWATGEIIDMIRSRNFKRILDRLLTDMFERKLLASPIGRLESLLPEKVKEGISDFLLEQTSSLLIKEVPNLVDSLNIKDIVTRKVDSLDLLKLEGLLLSIMQEQFKYINLFGGLLGFIIGLCNLLFLLSL
jgi:uncharacterized membrane protein YheB (UPF0754 family)